MFENIVRKTYKTLKHNEYQVRNKTLLASVAFAQFKLCNV